MSALTSSSNFHHRRPLTYLPSVARVSCTKWQHSLCPNSLHLTQPFTWVTSVSCTHGYSKQGGKKGCWEACGTNIPGNTKWLGMVMRNNQISLGKKLKKTLCPLDKHLQTLNRQPAAPWSDSLKRNEFELVVLKDKQLRLQMWLSW